MPGAMTIKEVVEGMEAGADIIKIFPGELFGPISVLCVSAVRFCFICFKGCEDMQRT
ncbi:hypothetical protein LMF89_21310 [Pelosinus sp. Bkl1]|uniref:2-dehydro-3-deoxy-phosphogluconate aldolase n=1 Tax=Pelosinus baikalensis TaxID=2892015 RepID=A0ABS8HXI4_9FIRM|nr:hypothetical protein [Pelosinus baikalensis]